MTDNSPTAPPPPGPLPYVLPHEALYPSVPMDTPTIHLMTDRWLAEEMVTCLHDLEVVVRRMDSELAEHRRRLDYRPGWADDILEAVAKIEVSRSIRLRVDALEVQVVELRKQRRLLDDGCGASNCPRKLSHG